VRDCRIQNFSGTDAYGIKVGSVVLFTATKIYVSGCDTGMLVSGVSTPTVSRFTQCAFVSSARHGMFVKTGYEMVFDSCVFESNSLEGAKVAPPVEATDISFNSCWFEDNYRLHPSRTSNYSLVVSGAARVYVNDCYFNVNAGTTERAARITDAPGFQLNNPQVSLPHAAYLCTIDGTSSGLFRAPANIEWQEIVTAAPTAGLSMFAAMSVIDALDGYVPTYDAANARWNAEVPVADGSPWLSWVPSYGSFGSMTVTSTSTTNATYKKIGKTAHVSLCFSGTLGGTQHSTIWAAGGRDCPSHIELLYRGDRPQWRRHICHKHSAPIDFRGWQDLLLWAGFWQLGLGRQFRHVLLRHLRNRLGDQKDPNGHNLPRQPRLHAA
jgi:hypothetical protein